MMCAKGHCLASQGSIRGTDSNSFWILFHAYFWVPGLKQIQIYLKTQHLSQRNFFILGKNTPKTHIRQERK